MEKLKEHVIGIIVIIFMIGWPWIVLSIFDMAINLQLPNVARWPVELRVSSAFISIVMFLIMMVSLTS